MSSGTKASMLKASKGVGLGFVDGDIEIVWHPSTT
jgi:hypothetical protein